MTATASEATRSVTSTRTAITTSTSTATATSTPQVGSCSTTGVVIGSITSEDPVQVGRLNRDGVSSTCATPKNCPGSIDSSPYHYDSYTVTNTTGQVLCYTVNLDAGLCTGDHYLFSAAYRTSFDPTNICDNYLADMGASPTRSGAYSFELAPGERAVVVVQEVFSGSGCDAYGITISTCPCATSFIDVLPSDYFYPAVEYLACHNAISGYADNTFRPYNNTTRGQLSKIVVLAQGWGINTTGGPHFSDVPTDNPFYSYIETAFNHSVISGYADGTFRWGNNVTRGQLSKIVVTAQGWAIDTSGGPHFSDVPPTSTFYTFIETAYNHGIISGYADGAFRPGNNATRGQISKITYNAVIAP